jgi:ergothioneine biosynthesis protein EgtB
MTPSDPGATTACEAALVRRYAAVRAATVALAAPLSPEDCALQSMPDASPVRWHLAHTTWFFETFVLREWRPERPPFDPSHEYLFNSYYNGIGAQFPRPRRGMISRPGLEEVLRYREQVDADLAELLEGGALEGPRGEELAARVELGLQHEQQHQELVLTDLKHAFSENPLHPVYRPLERGAAGPAPAPTSFEPFEGGEAWIGAREGSGFHFDNEGPRHRVHLEAFELARRPVTCGEYLAFVEDDGYRRPELWLSDGWDAAREHGWQAPLYWSHQDDRWWQYTLGGLRPVDPAEPVTHVSYYEADAFARWADARLPGEAEWEHAASERPVEGHFARPGGEHPFPLHGEAHGLERLFGDVWEWTASDYAPYPRYRPAEGAIGEYNGKFMCNQRVLRGGSCATPEGHARATYRNFFYPHMRWQFSGIRLARWLR